MVEPQGPGPEARCPCCPRRSSTTTAPGAPTHNDENLGLEAVWPYAVTGDSGSLTALAKLIHNGDGSISLKAVNGDYVTAENAGASALIANRTAIGPWEEFDVIS